MLTNLQEKKMFISRGSHGGGWRAESDIPIGGDLQLKVSTSKTSGGLLVTRAQVGRVKDDCFSFMLFQDYSKAIFATRQRVTDKVVEAQQSQALNELDPVLVDIRKQYGAEVTV